IADLVPEDVLVGERLAAAATRDRPADREPVALRERGEEFPHLRPAVALEEERVEVAVVGEEGDHLGAECLLFGRESRVHAPPFRSSPGPPDRTSLAFGSVRETCGSLRAEDGSRAFGSGFQRGARFSANARG